MARGTVRIAYDMLASEQLIAGRGAAGTFVGRQVFRGRGSTPDDAAPILPNFYRDWEGAPAPFQLGVPAQDAFPFKLWSRLVARSARDAAAAPVTAPDPRGDPGLRQEIVSYLAIARGIHCVPSQIIITGGFAGALGMALQALQLQGASCWVEDPGFPITRKALGFGGVSCVPVPVDAEGLDVKAGIARAPNAKLAVVTPGQQAPLGMAMSLARRRALLDWAERKGSWIIEDDYLSELQLGGRSAPALASVDKAGRVLHAGTFSKTISPALRLGFLLVPPEQAHLFGEYAACLSPASAMGLQRAVATFMAGGHYLRHLRRMKRLYTARRANLIAALQKIGGKKFTRIEAAGSHAVRVEFKSRKRDTDIAQAAMTAGLAPAPLSPWYQQDESCQGLLLGFTNFDEKRDMAACRRLLEIIG